MPNDLTMTETLRREMTARASTASTATVWTLSGLVLAACGGGGGGGTSGPSNAQVMVSSMTLRLEEDGSLASSQQPTPVPTITQANIAARGVTTTAEAMSAGFTIADNDGTALAGRFEATDMSSVGANQGGGDSGYYGEFIIHHETGAWSYNIDNSLVPLGTGMLTEIITITFDPTPAGQDNVTISLTFTIAHNAPPAFTNAPITRTVNETRNSATEDTGVDASGTLTASDDGNMTTFGIMGQNTPGNTVTAEGMYGNLVVTTATGVWSYALGVTQAQRDALNNANFGDGARSGVNNLPAETFTVTVSDGRNPVVTQDLTITVNGANEPAVPIAGTSLPAVVPLYNGANVMPTYQYDGASMVNSMFSFLGTPARFQISDDVVFTISDLVITLDDKGTPISSDDTVAISDFNVTANDVVLTASYRGFTAYLTVSNIDFTLTASPTAYRQQSGLMPDDPITLEEFEAGRFTMVADLDEKPFDVGLRIADSSGRNIYNRDLTITFDDEGFYTIDLLQGLDTITALGGTFTFKPGQNYQTATYRIRYDGDSLYNSVLDGFIIAPDGESAMNHVRITGNNRVGDVLTADISGYLAYDTANNIPGTPTAMSYQWYNNGTPIAGATSSTFMTTAAGEHHVVVNILNTNGGKNFGVAIPSRSVNIGPASGNVLPSLSLDSYGARILDAAGTAVFTATATDPDAEDNIEFVVTVMRPETAQPRFFSFDYNPIEDAGIDLTSVTGPATSDVFFSDGASTTPMEMEGTRVNIGLIQPDNGPVPPFSNIGTLSVTGTGRERTFTFTPTRDALDAVDAGGVEEVVFEITARNGSGNGQSALNSQSALYRVSLVGESFLDGLVDAFANPVFVNDLTVTQPTLNTPIDATNDRDDDDRRTFTLNFITIEGENDSAISIVASGRGNGSSDYFYADEPDTPYGDFDVGVPYVFYLILGNSSRASEHFVRKADFESNSKIQANDHVYVIGEFIRNANNTATFTVNAMPAAGSVEDSFVMDDLSDDPASPADDPAAGLQDFA